MGAADQDKMLALTRSLPERDLLFLRYDITDPAIVADWIDKIESGNMVTILAEENDRLIGYSSLHRSNILWTRHLGEILMLVSNNYRGKGVGRQLIQQIFPCAHEFGFQKLMLQMMSTQRDAQTLFHHLGFIPEALLHDWAIDRNGRTHDMIIMSREVDEDLCEVMASDEDTAFGQDIAFGQDTASGE
jgi:RimJ/RimL family protein N-acetyltransferase